MRILIADDNRDVGTVLGILLRRCGHAVDVVNDGAQCLSHLESFTPDVLLLDILMPDVCGYDLAKQIRSQPEFSTMAIIALSGFADAEHAELSLAAGCDEHVAKPADPSTLGLAMARAVQSRRQPSTKVSPSSN